MYTKLIMTPQNLNDDYMNNFMPRKEITLFLTMDEIVALLKEKQLQEQIAMTPPFKFYVKQLVLSSFKKMTDGIQGNPIKIAELDEAFEKFRRDQADFGNDLTQLIGLQVALTYFPDTLSNLKLCDAFSGSGLHDDWCAQRAYEIYWERKALKNS